MNMYRWKQKFSKDGTKVLLARPNDIELDRTETIEAHDPYWLPEYHVWHTHITIYQVWPCPGYRSTTLRIMKFTVTCILSSNLNLVPLNMSFSNVLHIYTQHYQVWPYSRGKTFTPGITIFTILVVVFLLYITMHLVFTINSSTKDF
jgi:hypothetical protein